MTEHKSGTEYRRTVLDNGVRVVTEHMPQVRSLALGFWFITGSRDETDDLAGIAHFLEHMNFKGTEKRSSAAIAREIESRGGPLNAYTPKDMTCYYARMADEHTAKAVDVLADLTQNSVLDPTEIDRERQVILEELKSIEDTPDELVFEHHIAHLYNGHAMGRSVIGTRESLGRIDRESMVRHVADHYCGSNVVVTAAGNLNHGRLARMIERRFQSESIPNQVRKAPNDPPNKSFRREDRTNTQQAHILYGCRGIHFSDPRKFALLLMNTILGGGMSSRLFQQVREKHGLAYTVFALSESFQDTGLFAVYAATDPNKTDQALDLIRRELKRIARKPISNRELNRAKDQVKGNIVLGLESPNSRMTRIAKSQIYNHEWLSLDEVISRINAVTADDIQRLAVDLFEERAEFTTLLLPH